MTVLIAVNTRDAIVLGADSLGTVTRQFVSPDDLAEFFDLQNGRGLRTGADGRPLLDAWSRIACRAVELPFKAHTGVEKIFSLEPLKMGVMASGVASLGNRTVKGLIAEFKTTAAFNGLDRSEDTLVDTANAMLEFLWPKYAESYPGGRGPDSELMLCGYDRDRYTPGVVRVYVQGKRVGEPDYDFCIFFGGTTREVQRLLFGLDSESKARLIRRSRQLLEDYRDRLGRRLRENGVDIDLPRPDDFGEELSLFHDLELNSLKMNCATYSERDAIECADFLVNVMIKSQKFSNQLASTGGEAQIAMIKKHAGFQFITPRPSYLDDCRCGK